MCVRAFKKTKFVILAGQLLLSACVLIVLKVGYQSGQMLSKPVRMLKTPQDKKSEDVVLCWRTVPLGRG